jgi:cytochrome P450
VAAARANDDDLLQRYVLEALRFRSPASILLRYATEDYIVAKGTERAKTIPAGRLVIASNASAMMDDTEVDAPKEFRAGRPPSQYLHFGFGIHQCFGKYISQVQVTELVKHLLRLDNLRRAPGATGQLNFSGIYPKTFTIQWDPPTAH